MINPIDGDQKVFQRFSRRAVSKRFISNSTSEMANCRRIIGKYSNAHFCAEVNRNFSIKLRWVKIWFPLAVGLSVKPFYYDAKFWYNFLRTKKFAVRCWKSTKFEKIKLSTAVVILNDILSGIRNRKIVLLFYKSIYMCIQR